MFLKKTTGKINERNRRKMNKPVYLGLPILDIIKITMYEYWYDYAKRKFGDIVKLCCMDMDSFIVQNELTILS